MDSEFKLQEEKTLQILIHIRKTKSFFKGLKKAHIQLQESYRSLIAKYKDQGQSSFSTLNSSQIEACCHYLDSNKNTIELLSSSYSLLKKFTQSLKQEIKIVRRVSRHSKEIANINTKSSQSPIKSHNDLGQIQTYVDKLENNTMNAIQDAISNYRNLQKENESVYVERSIKHTRTYTEKIWSNK